MVVVGVGDRPGGHRPSGLRGQRHTEEWTPISFVAASARAEGGGARPPKVRRRHESPAGISPVSALASERASASQAA
jgi:hypothetical protein